MRILAATTFALSLSAAALGVSAAPALADDDTAILSISPELQQQLGDQLEDLHVDDLTSIKVPLALAQDICGDQINVGDTCAPDSLSSDQIGQLVSALDDESGDDNGNGGNGNNGGNNSAKAFAPGQIEQPANEVAPGHQDDPQAAAPGQMKKDTSGDDSGDGGDSGSGSGDNAPGNSGNAPGHNK